MMMNYGNKDMKMNMVVIRRRRKVRRRKVRRRKVRRRKSEEEVLFSHKLSQVSLKALSKLSVSGESLKNIRII